MLAQSIKHGRQNSPDAQCGENGQFLPCQFCENEDEQGTEGEAQGSEEGYCAPHLAFGDFATLHLALRPGTMCSIHAFREVAVVVGEVAEDLQQNGGQCAKYYR